MKFLLDAQRVFVMPAESRLLVAGSFTPSIPRPSCGRRRLRRVTEGGNPLLKGEHLAVPRLAPRDPETRRCEYPSRYVWTPRGAFAAGVDHLVPGSLMTIRWTRGSFKDRKPHLHRPSQVWRGKLPPCRHMTTRINCAPRESGGSYHEILRKRELYLSNACDEFAHEHPPVCAT